MSGTGGKGTGGDFVQAAALKQVSFCCLKGYFTFPHVPVGDALSEDAERRL